MNQERFGLNDLQRFVMPMLVTIGLSILGYLASQMKNYSESINNILAESRAYTDQAIERYKETNAPFVSEFMEYRKNQSQMKTDIEVIKVLLIKGESNEKKR